jgi:hemerythrin
VTLLSLNHPSRDPRVESLVSKLRREHDDMETHFQRVLDAAHGGDWRACDEIWDSFERALSEHIAFEEASLFPLYGASSSQREEDAERLRREHDTLLKRMEAFGDELQMHHTTRAADGLIAALRDHARREDELFHPWVSAQDPPC